LLTKLPAGREAEKDDNFTLVCFTTFPVEGKDIIVKIREGPLGY
jgi:hypothetical protein